MRYLTVGADYTLSGLRDDFKGPVEPETLGLPTDLCTELRVWNDRYRKIIPLDQEGRRRADNAELIDSLDKQGQEIAKRVVSALQEDVKVRYYSEGQLQYLTP